MTKKKKTKKNEHKISKKHKIEKKAKKNNWTYIGISLVMALFIIVFLYFFYKSYDLAPMPKMNFGQKAQSLSIDTNTLNEDEKAKLLEHCFVKNAETFDFDIYIYKAESKYYLYLADYDKYQKQSYLLNYSHKKFCSKKDMWTDCQFLDQAGIDEKKEFIENLLNEIKENVDLNCEYIKLDNKRFNIAQH